MSSRCGSGWVPVGQGGAGGGRRRTVTLLVKRRKHELLQHSPQRNRDTGFLGLAPGEVPRSRCRGGAVAAGHAAELLLARRRRRGKLGRKAVRQHLQCKYTVTLPLFGM